jgi:Holliday junction resolvasome RuvABC endonuclease subunit
MTQKILAFDVSSTTTGWAVLTSGRFYKTEKNFGTIKIPSNQTLAEKLVYFRNTVENIIQTVSPSYIVIEDVYIGHKSTIVILSRFSGVILELVSRLGYTPNLINATKARSLLKIKNHKQEAFNFINKKYSLSWDFKDKNDITDALILALSFNILLKNQS